MQGSMEINGWALLGLSAKIQMHVMADQCGKNRMGVDLGSSRCLCIPASPLSFHCVALGLIAAMK